MRHPAETFQIRWILFESRRSLAVSSDAAAIFSLRHGLGHSLRSDTRRQSGDHSGIQSRAAAARRRLGRVGTGQRCVLDLHLPTHSFTAAGAIAAAVGLMYFGNALTSISTPILFYSHESRPLAILLLEYSFTGELERAAALGLLITAIISAMMLLSRKLGLKLAGSD